jgi:hypothetical protein
VHYYRCRLLVVAAVLLSCALTCGGSGSGGVQGEWLVRSVGGL